MGASFLYKYDKNDILIKDCNDFKKEISKDTINYNAISPEITPKYISTTSSKATASAATGTATIEQKTIFDEKTGK